MGWDYGSKVKFWEDVWCGEDPFCEKFPTLCAMTDSKRAKIKEVWESSREEGVGTLVL